VGPKANKEVVSRSQNLYRTLRRALSPPRSS